jgi:hypothetical protein
LQILTAGAGTAHRMPEGAEYLHCVQAAVDQYGLRYQVLDTAGERHECLSWPVMLPPSDEWQPLSLGVNANPIEAGEAILLAFEFVGEVSLTGEACPIQTLLTMVGDNPAELAPMWVGIVGEDERLMVKISPRPGRSPHMWVGPRIALDEPFQFQIAFHAGMGAGGILWRWSDNDVWTSFEGISYWGTERVNYGSYWHVGHGQRGSTDAPLTSHNLSVKWHTQSLTL